LNAPPIATSQIDGSRFPTGWRERAEECIERLGSLVASPPRLFQRGSNPFELFLCGALVELGPLSIRVSHCR
jgi:hypothetical protein